MRASLLGLLICIASVFAETPQDLVKVNFVTSVASVQPSTPFQIAVQFSIAPGWHVYWLNPGDGGLPTRVTLQLPAGWTATPLAYPVPQTFDLPGGLTSYGYENHATLLATITPGNDVAASNVIACKAHWLVCKDVCKTGTATPSLTLPRGSQAAVSFNPQPFADAQAAMPLEAGQADAVGEISDDFELSPDGKSGTLAVIIRWKRARPDRVAFFPPPAAGINFAKPSVNSEPTRTTITTSFELLAGKKPPVGAIDSVLSWQLGDKLTGVKVPIHFESHTQTVK